MAERDRDAEADGVKREHPEYGNEFSVFSFSDFYD